jgi:hypothetical protein
MIDSHVLALSRLDEGLSFFPSMSIPRCALGNAEATGNPLIQEHMGSGLTAAVDDTGIFPLARS